MHVTAGLTALLHHLLDQRQDRVADDLGLLAQQIEIKRRDICVSCNLLGAVRGDHAATRLRPSQRNLDLRIAGDRAEVRKHLPHPRRSKGVAKQQGIENGRGGRKSGHVCHLDCRHLDQLITYRTKPWHSGRSSRAKLALSYPSPLVAGESHLDLSLVWHG